MSDTAIVIYRPGKAPEQQTVPHPYGVQAVTSVVSPLLGGSDVDHVPVVYNGAWRDLFVDPMAEIRGMDRNEMATAVYQNYLLSKFPDTDIDTAPAIYGSAVLFCQDKVWR